MEHMIDMANQLISLIVNYTAFILIYGTIFYVIGYVIYSIIRSVYREIKPTLKRWYQSRKDKKQ